MFGKCCSETGCQIAEVFSRNLFKTQQVTHQVFFNDLMIDKMNRIT